MNTIHRYATGLMLTLTSCQPAASPEPASSATERPATAPNASRGGNSAVEPNAAGGESPAGVTPELSPADYQYVVDAANRSDADRLLDVGRHPAQLLAFGGVRPGMKVAELGAGGGYTAELLARAVGPEGVVYGHNSPFLLERFAEEPWTTRLSKPVMKNVVRVDAEFDTPIPQGVTDLDAVFLVLFYHDTVWQKTDRAKMNASIFASLRSGGVYLVVDHSAKNGEGTTQAQTLHRIEEAVVRSEVQAAGFQLDASAEFLRNPDDARDWNAAPSKAGQRRGTSDRFVLRFRKP